MKSNIKIFLCQLNFHVGNLNKNLDNIITRREKVMSHGGGLCIFSELSITGYPPEDLVLKNSFIINVEEVINKLISLSKDGGPAIIVGYPRNDNGKLKNLLGKNGIYYAKNEFDLIHFLNIFEVISKIDEPNFKALEGSPMPIKLIIRSYLIESLNSSNPFNMHCSKFKCLLSNHSW